MKFFTTTSAYLFVINFLIGPVVMSQNAPEVLYYKFKNNVNIVTPNYAVPGQGLLMATRTGLGFTSGGQFDSCLTGNGSTTNYLNSGWATNRGTGNWTISLWLSNLQGDVYATYLFGDTTTPGQFRCFYAGAAGPQNVMLRGTFSDVLVTNVMPGPTVLHFVYNGSSIVVYKNGANPTTYPASAINLSGSGPFKIGGYGVSYRGLNGKIDEFRFYNRALDAGEIALTWNHELPLLTGIENITNNSTNFMLYQNYPNPFNPYTTIKYSIKEDGYVTFKVFDILGHKVFSLNEFRYAGSNEFVFDGSNYSSGEYFYRIETTGFNDVKKMILVK